jgi:FAD/FMN-containing dehydrogenase
VLIELSDVLQTPLAPPLLDALQTFGTGITEFAVDSKGSTVNWWNLRKNISEAQKREGISIKHDVAVPISHVAEFIARANAALHTAFTGLRIVAFGHIGDGNIHYNISMLDSAQNPAFIAQSQRVNSIVYDIVHELNGSISAEHGLGQLKRNEIRHYKSALELELMRGIKHTLDPHNLMNPGKVI